MSRDIEPMVHALADYGTVVNQTLQEVCKALMDERYGEACQLMSHLSQVQAKTSLDMRTALVKLGHVGGDDDSGD